MVCYTYFLCHILSLQFCLFFQCHKVKVGFHSVSLIIISWPSCVNAAKFPIQFIAFLHLYLLHNHTISAQTSHYYKTAPVWPQHERAWRRSQCGGMCCRWGATRCGVAANLKHRGWKRGPSCVLVPCPQRNHCLTCLQIGALIKNTAAGWMSLSKLNKSVVGI